MIASNHHKIYLDIYEDLIEGLERSGLLADADPFALYLGNWMADYSQLYSPDIPNTFIDLVSKRIDNSELQNDIRIALAAKLVQLQAFHKTYFLVATSNIKLEQIQKITQSRLAVENENTQTKKKSQPLDGATSYLATPVFIANTPAFEDPGKLKSLIAEVIDQAIIVPLIGIVEALPSFAASIANSINKDGDRVRNYLIDHRFTDRFNDTARVLVWFLGLCEFSKPSHRPKKQPDAKQAPPSASYIPPAEFSRLFSQYFGYYKPYEHLDRFLSLAKINQAVGRADNACPIETEIEEKRTLMAQRTANYRAFCVDIKAACIKEVGGTSDKPQSRDMDRSVDQVLWNSLEIAYGRMADVAALPPKAALPVNDRLLLLGRSLHVVEDYFSHTNFLDRLIFQLEQEGEFATHDFERRKIALNILNEKTGMSLAEPVLSGAIDLEHPAMKKALTEGISDCVKSGFFDIADSKHSLWHLFQGKVRSVLGMDDDEKDRHFLIVDALYNYFNKLKDETLKDLANTAELIGAKKRDENNAKYDASDYWFECLNNDRGATGVYLSEADVNYMLLGSTTFVPNSEHAKRLRNLVNLGFGLLLTWNLAVNVYNGAEQVNSAQKTVNALIKSRAMILKVLQAIRVLFLSSRAFLRFMRNACGGWLPKVFDVLLAVGFETAKEALRRAIDALFDLADATIESQAKHGSHSLIAKDEDHHQHRLYSLAEHFGILVDKCCLEIVFPKPDGASPDSAQGEANSSKNPAGQLAQLMRQFAYNPLHQITGSYNYEQRKYFVKAQVDVAQADQILKRSANMLADAYMQSNYKNEFSERKVAYVAALRAIAANNAQTVSLIEGQDHIALTDARFDCNRYVKDDANPKSHLPAGKTVLLFILKDLQSPMCKQQQNDKNEVVIRPIDVNFFYAVTKSFEGTALNWKEFGLDKVIGGHGEWQYQLPRDYRLLAQQFVSEYECIWRALLTSPGSFEKRWALGELGDHHSWY